MPKLMRIISFAIPLILTAPTARAQSIDLLFLVDETLTMPAEIAALQSQASSLIVPSAMAALGDVAFGVAAYRDFPVSPFGDPADFGYQLRQAISTNTTLFQVGLNSLSAGGGGDAAEANLHALYSVATISPGWRAGATRVVFWIGDAPGHDGDLEPSYASCCSEIGVADAVAALSAADIAVYAIDTASPGLDATGQASTITSATGGTLSNSLGGVGLSDAIVTIINGPLANPPPTVPALSPAGITAIAGALVASGLFARRRVRRRSR